MSAVDRFINWAVKRTRSGPRAIVTFQGTRLFDRFEFLAPDEWPDEFWDEHKASCKCFWCKCKTVRPYALPWWRPFNAFLHNWKMGLGAEVEPMHDHPRWSITVVLRGQIREVTPWQSRDLRPGSVVIRSRKAIHGFQLVDDSDVWTLFIVGRRKHRQNA